MTGTFKKPLHKDFLKNSFKGKIFTSGQFRTTLFLTSRPSAIVWNELINTLVNDAFISVINTSRLGTDQYKLN